MVTSNYGDLHQGSRSVGMMLQNLSAQEVRVPTKTVIGNVQMAEIVPNMKALRPTSDVLPLKEQKGLSEVGWSSCSNSPENEVTQPTPISLQLELGVAISEHTVFVKVDSWGCIKWDPKGPKGREENFGGICRCLF